MLVFAHMNHTHSTLDQQVKNFVVAQLLGEYHWDLDCAERFRPFDLTQKHLEQFRELYFQHHYGKDPHYLKWLNGQTRGMSMRMQEKYEKLKFLNTDIGAFSVKVVFKLLGLPFENWFSKHAESGCIQTDEDLLSVLPSSAMRSWVNGLDKNEQFSLFFHSFKMFNVQDFFSELDIKQLFYDCWNKLKTQQETVQSVHEVAFGFASNQTCLLGFNMIRALPVSKIPQPTRQLWEAFHHQAQPQTFHSDEEIVLAQHLADEWLKQEDAVELYQWFKNHFEQKRVVW